MPSTTDAPEPSRDLTGSRPRSIVCQDADGSRYVSHDDLKKLIADAREEAKHFGWQMVFESLARVCECDSVEDLL